MLFQRYGCICFCLDSRHSTKDLLKEVIEYALCVADMMKQANAYAPGWGQTIFQSANEMMNNDIYRKRMEEQQSKVEEERQWWDKKKTSIQESFMKELDDTSAATTSAATKASTKSFEDTKASPAPAASVQGSDDDAVLVEADPSTNTPASPASPAGGGKKKKGKGKK